MDLSVLFVSPRVRLPQRRPYGFYEFIIHVSEAVEKVALIEPPPMTNAKLPPSVRGYEVPVINPMRPVDWPLPHVARVIRLLRTLEPEYDIVHFFSQNYLFSLCGMLLDKTKVITIESFPGIDYDHGDIIINALSGFYTQTFAKLALKHMDAVIGLSSSALRALEALGVRPKHTVRIPLGIDTHEIRPDEKLGLEVRDELGLGEIVAIFLGRLSPVKGITFLGRAMEMLESRGMDIDLLVIGDGPERGALERLVSNRHARVHLMGFKPDPLRFIHASDFLILPSLGEGCPNVVLEAFACGRPVVATCVGAVPDLVKPGITGLVVKPRDAEGLAKAIARMASDLERTREMGRRARKYAEEELDWRVIIKRAISFYEQILS